jgi:Holliday junction resolvase
MAERDVVAAVIKRLRKAGAFAIKIHGDQMQPAVIDVIACYRGRFIGIECKRDAHHKPTPRQTHNMAQIEAAGGITGVAWTVAQVETMLLRAEVGL